VIIAFVRVPELNSPVKVGNIIDKGVEIVELGQFLKPLRHEVVKFKALVNLLLDGVRSALNDGLSLRLELLQGLLRRLLAIADLALQGFLELVSNGIGRLIDLCLHLGGNRRDVLIDELLEVGLRLLALFLHFLGDVVEAELVLERGLLLLEHVDGRLDSVLLLGDLCEDDIFVSLCGLGNFIDLGLCLLSLLLQRGADFSFPLLELFSRFLHLLLDELLLLGDNLLDLLLVHLNTLLHGFLGLGNLLLAHLILLLQVLEGVGSNLLNLSLLLLELFLLCITSFLQLFILFLHSLVDFGGLGLGLCLLLIEFILHLIALDFTTVLLHGHEGVVRHAIDDLVALLDLSLFSFGSLLLQHIFGELLTFSLQVVDEVGLGELCVLLLKLLLLRLRLYDLGRSGWLLIKLLEERVKNGVGGLRVPVEDDQ
jgi:hypothetical protein